MQQVKQMSAAITDKELREQAGSFCISKGLPLVVPDSMSGEYLDLANTWI
jgi:hypothetical protein